MRSTPLILTLTAPVALGRSIVQQPLPAPIPAASTNASITSDLLDSLHELARLVDIAYCVSTTGVQKPFECLSWCTEFSDFELLETFNTGPLLADTAGYLALDHRPDDPRIILAFRGTYNVANTITDLSTLPQKYVPYAPPNDTLSQAIDFGRKLFSIDKNDCANCTVHAGFLKSWLSSRESIIDSIEGAKTKNPAYTIHITGHSLGGAVGLLAALDFQARGWRPIVTTFGEPRVGNDAFVDYVESMDWTYRRVTHVDDPVPLLPPMNMGFRSHGSELYVKKMDLPAEIEDVVICDGAEDEECSASGENSRLWQLFFSHRDYFVRMGLCMRKDNMIRGSSGRWSRAR